MNKRIIVIATICVAVAGFAAAWFAYNQRAVEQQAAAPAIDASGADLVRFSSPVLGPADARTTIVEFFDPACEACRAFYPVVKDILAEQNGKVRVVMRYAPFHDVSEEAVRILETARLQGKFEPVLEALMASQPQWAAHGGGNLDVAWEAARKAGLDVDQAKQKMSIPAIDAIIAQDVADGKAFNVKQTPTFFVDGKPLTNFGRQQLKDLVEVQVAAKQ